MNRTPNVELVLHEYLAADGDRAPDHVLETVADRIGRQPQRRTWPFPGRTTVTQLKLAAALAAAVIVAVVGYNLLPRQPGSGGQVTPFTTPAASPTTMPTATGPVVLPDGTLTGGRYRIQPFSDKPSLSVLADIPAGWHGFPGNGTVTGPTQNHEVLLSFMVVDALFSDPCHWDLDASQSGDQPGDVTVGPTVEALVAALKANGSYSSSAATPVTIGAYQGQELELQLPGGDVISTCDNRQGQSTGDYFVFPKGFYAQGANNRWDLFILDVQGTRLITFISSFDTSPPAEVAAAKAIVHSFEIAP
jgi:hypothetical protein